MGELPTWAVILAGGVSFGFGAGGAWIALGYRLKALEQWKREHGATAEGGLERLQKLERDYGKLDTIVVGVTGRNGHAGELRTLRRAMHDVNNWIAGAQDKIGVPFHRTKREDE